MVIGAARTPTGRRGGLLSSVHPISLLAQVQSAVLDRTQIDPADVGQVVGGCVGQVGAQTGNVTRNAWLAAGLPITVPGTTIDSQCGSSQQATNLAYSLIRSGVVDVAMACGVEVMSLVPMGSTVPKDPIVGKPVNRDYWKHHEFTSQFEGAERIAEKWGIARADCDAFGKRSQDRAIEAWSDGRFSSRIVEVSLPGESGDVLGLTRDEGLRETTLEALGALKPTGRTDGVHTAGTSSQIADGAAAVVLSTRDWAQSRDCEPLADHP